MKKKILVLNAGSSSLKFSLFSQDLKKEAWGIADAFGLPNSLFTVFWYDVQTKKLQQNKQSVLLKHHKDALHHLFRFLQEKAILKTKEDILAIGHRIVHGGPLYQESMLLTSEVLRQLKKISFLAPLHNPHNLHGVLVCKKLFPHVPQIGVFDTTFHTTIPAYAAHYPLPQKIIKKYHIKKYGFHGTSYRSILRKLKQITKTYGYAFPKRLIVAHMGNGISITAIKNGKSIDTSMGFTPLAGMPMGTRSGDLDPGLVLFLLEQGYSPEELDEIFNHQAGLKAMAGTSDMRIIRKRALQGDKKARFALDMLAYKASWFIGAFLGALKGLDALVFTGGMGEGAWYLRSKILAHFAFLGIREDYEKNKNHAELITKKNSSLPVFVLHTDEEEQIAHDVLAILRKQK